MTKVHVEAKKFAAEGYTIVLVGHEGHEEVEGTMGEAPDHFVLVETEEDVDSLELPDPDRVAFLTQTTLSVDETDRDHPPAARAVPEHHRAEVGRHLLRDDQPPARRAPDGARVRPRARDRLAQLLELEPAGRGRARPRRRVAPDRQRGARSQEEWLEGKRVVGISSGASAPEELVQRLIDFFRERGTSDVSEFEVVQEDVRFMLPKEIRKALAARA